MIVGAPTEKPPGEIKGRLRFELGSRCDIFNKKLLNGGYSSVQHHADSLRYLILEYHSAENGVVDKPYEFLRRLREAEEDLLLQTQDESEKMKIREMYQLFDIPGIELPDKE